MYTEPVYTEILSVHLLQEPSLNVVKEDGRHYEYDASNAEVGETVSVGPPEELATVVLLEHTPEQCSKWSH